MELPAPVRYPWQHEQRGVAPCAGKMCGAGIYADDQIELAAQGCGVRHVVQRLMGIENSRVRTQGGGICGSQRFLKADVVTSIRQPGKQGRRCRVPGCCALVGVFSKRAHPLREACRERHERERHTHQSKTAQVVRGSHGVCL